MFVKAINLTKRISSRAILIITAVFAGIISASVIALITGIFNMWLFKLAMLNGIFGSLLVLILDLRSNKNK